MRFPTLCLSRNFLILGLCLLRRSSSSKKGRQHGLFVYRVGGRSGREFSGLFAFIFIVSAKSSTFCAARFFGPVPPAMSTAAAAAASAVCGKVYFH